MTDDVMGSIEDEASAEAADTPPAESQSATTWRDSLPDDLKDDPKLARYETPADLAKAYKEAEKKIGWDPSSVVKMPGQDASPEDYEPLYKALGRPDRPEAYEAPAVDIGDGRQFKFDNEFVDSVRKAAYEAGIGKRQFEKLMRATGTHHKNKLLLREQDSTKAKQDFEKNLKAEWGDKYDENKQMVDLARENLKGQNQQVAMLNLLAKHGASLQEDQVISEGQTAGAGAPNSIKEARAELEKFNNNKELMQKWRAKDPETMKKRRDLYNAAYPEKKKG